MDNNYGNNGQSNNNGQPNYNGQPSYNGQPYYYNSMSTPNQLPEVKKRRTASVVLSIFLAFIIFFFIITLSLRLGTFNGSDLKNFATNSGVTEQLKEELINEMDEDSAWSDDVKDQLDNSISTFLSYYIDVIFEGEIPDKDRIEEDLTQIYDDVCEAMASDIVKELNNKGPVNASAIGNLNTVKGMENMFGSQGYDTIIASIEEQVGETLDINDSNADDYERIIKETFIANRRDLSHVVDDIYDSMADLTISTGDERVQLTIGNVYETLAMGVLVAVIVMAVIILGIIAIIAIIDKDAKVTLKGMLVPFFVPGLIIFIFAALIRGVTSLIIAASDLDTNTRGIINELVSAVENPFIIVSLVACIIAIAAKIVGNCIKKAE